MASRKNDTLKRIEELEERHLPKVFFYRPKKAGAVGKFFAREAALQKRLTHLERVISMKIKSEKHLGKFSRYLSEKGVPNGKTSDDFKGWYHHSLGGEPQMMNGNQTLHKVLAHLFDTPHYNLVTAQWSQGGLKHTFEAVADDQRQPGSRPLMRTARRTVLLQIAHQTGSKKPGRMSLEVSPGARENAMRHVKSYEEFWKESRKYLEKYGKPVE